MKSKQFLTGAISGVIFAVVLFSAVSLGASSFTKLNVGGKASEILDYLENNYVDDIVISDIEESMYSGLVNGVNDKYTSYMPEEVYNSFLEEMRGTYAGIGVYVTIDKNDGLIKVTSPIEGSPGEQAGIMPEDKIIKVNGYEVTGEFIDEAISMMKGPSNTSVKLSIFRESEMRTFDIEITRAKINVPTVSYKMLENKIGYIKIIAFEEVTYNQFMEAYNFLNDLGQESLIIDVRNNPGGYFHIVCEICDELLPECTIVFTEDKNKTREYKQSDSNSFGKPIIVLVNEGSASASEILAGAIKDNNAGKLVGEKTYGKGLVQRVFTLSDGSAVKITVQKYFTPSGVCIQGIGIEPDHLVELPKDLKVKVSMTDEEDIQLQKAITLLKK